MIYLDNAATTIPKKEFLIEAQQFNNEKFYNPSALYHGAIENNKMLKNARENILKCLGSVNHQVIFTSCGSESDNMAIFCTVKRGVFVTSKGEHSAVHNSFLELKNRGHQVEFIDLLPNGAVDTEKLFAFAKSVKIDFISLVHVNNETGAINDVNFIAKKLKEINPKLVFHVDGVQAFGKIPYKISSDIDLYSISAHKINALKGTGALIKKKNLNINPLIFGGGQENGLRSGTENIFGIKVFELATLNKYQNLTKNYEEVAKLNQFVRESIKDYCEIIHDDNASPYILMVAVAGLKGEIIMHALEKLDIIVGNGSACSSKHKHSRILAACGYKEKTLDGVIRISFSSDTTKSECEIFVQKFIETILELKGKIL